MVDDGNYPIKPEANGEHNDTIRVCSAVLMEKIVEEKRTKVRREQKKQCGLWNGQV